VSWSESDRFVVDLR